jgi:hypothetical protein
MNKKSPKTHNKEKPAQKKGGIVCGRSIYGCALLL